MGCQRKGSPELDEQLGLILTVWCQPASLQPELPGQKALCSEINSRRAKQFSQAFQISRPNQFVTVVWLWIFTTYTY